MTEILDKETIKALSADSRQTIIKMLAKRPYTASEIAKATGKHVTTITEHLDTLERSDLIRKKETTNKWVYYELTQKGEHLFKPQSYSWVLVFSLSVVFMFTGFLRLTQSDFGAKVGASQSMPMMAGAAQNQMIYAAPADYLAYLLIGLGIIGLIYLVYRKWLSR